MGHDVIANGLTYGCASHLQGAQRNRTYNTFAVTRRGLRPMDAAGASVIG
jgi:hypothetical protein